jgi:methyl-accepting chemotaxis protein
LLLSWLIGRGIAKPIRVLVGLLQRMAKGETIEITGVERKDEVGETARAVNEIKVMLADKAHQEAEAKAEADRLAAIEREAAMKKMEVEFEAAVGGIVTAAVAGDFSQRVEPASCSISAPRSIRCARTWPRRSTTSSRCSMHWPRAI